jgi:hypothetical protein
MSRNLFEKWGKDLKPEEFSIALAGLAVFGPLTDTSSRDEITTKAKKSVLQVSPFIVKASLPNITSAIKQNRERTLQFSASVYAQLWKTFFMDFGDPENISIELNAKLRKNGRTYSADTEAIDIFWVLRELERPGGAAGSAYFRDNKRELPVAFELPLRFGILEDNPETERIAHIIDHSYWPHLCKIVRPQENELRCDILLLPFDLRTAANVVGKGNHNIEADCVIIMGGLGPINSAEAITLIARMRETVKTSSFCIVTVPASLDGHRLWLNHLLRSLSHDTPLINALTIVQQEIGSRTTLDLPLIIASRRLATGARAREFATRLELAVRSAAHNLDNREEVNYLNQQVDRLAFVQAGRWQSELGDAKEFVDIREAIEELLGESLTVPRLDSSTSSSGRRSFRPKKISLQDADEPPSPCLSDKPPSLHRARSTPDRRRVLIDLYDVTNRQSPKKVKNRLLTNRRYEIELFIAGVRQATVIAPESFPSDELPPGNNDLSVHFVPLVRDENGKFMASQCKSMVLPDTADSTACKFNFNVPSKIETYRARLIISFQNRVMQTLILSAPVGNAEGNFVLDVENIVDQSFERLLERPKFDAAIIVNDSPSGVSGLITIKGNEAIFTEPEGLKIVSDAIRQIILEEAAIPEPSKKYNCKQIQQLLYKLSRLGKCLWDTLPSTAKNLFQDGTARIQVVDVRIGAYFPAEFVHPGLSPIDSARLCPNGEATLKPISPKNFPSKASHEKCEYKGDDNYICPGRMWGLGSIIERQPATGAPSQGFILRDATSEIGKANKDVLNHVVLAVSEKVTNYASEATNKLLDSLKGIAKEVSYAADWESLKKIVQNNSPTLLILLPHSGFDKRIPTIPALELGGTWLAQDHFKEQYVRGSKSVNPVVLLLGCDTSTTEIPFLNFIKRFMDCGAAMVMGTVTQIEVTRTVNFVERFITAINTSNKTASFGELLLQARRSMLAEGDAYALSLLAYGDSDQ